MTVIKKNGRETKFDFSRILSAIEKAYRSVGMELPNDHRKFYEASLSEDQFEGKVTVEQIQDRVKRVMAQQCPEAAVAYIEYAYKHKECGKNAQRIKYMMDYVRSKNNAADNSNTDANANSSCKNVTSLEAEVYKDNNRILQRTMMKSKLDELFPNEDLSRQYIKDLENHIIYTHDEGSSPVPKAYCGAYSTYPVIMKGMGSLDGVTPGPPNDMWSFSGQMANTVFALSAQTKGAVALGDFFLSFNWCATIEFGKDWYKRVDEDKLMKKSITKAIKQFIWMINQPQGNRGYSSPFTNINVFDEYYFKSLFGEYRNPDGSIPEWKQIDFLQREFMTVLLNIRRIQPVTFPVTTIALLYDADGYKDKNYEDFCAELWEKGSSHFLYHSDSADSLSSCCRVQNRIKDNTFSSTTGMVGVMTGSCNVITLNINRIVQDWSNTVSDSNKTLSEDRLVSLADYITAIVKRVHKYHKAYKTMLYELEENGMIPYSNFGMLKLSRLYCTVGTLGYYEAARFLGLKDGTKEYYDFMAYVHKVINECNKEESSYGKYPFVFNLECVPGESLAVKFYEWDKVNEYWIPEDQDLYNSYFFNPWTCTDIYTKLESHGKAVCSSTNGGQACHLNLDEHLTKDQYKQVMRMARELGCNHFTFNVPITKCKDCGHVVNGPVYKCPKCHSKNVSYFTRIIGFLTSVDQWADKRRKDFYARMFGKIRIRKDA